jgi:hypothetical protein
MQRIQHQHTKGLGAYNRGIKEGRTIACAQNVSGNARSISDQGFNSRRCYWSNGRP